MELGCRAGSGFGGEYVRYSGKGAADGEERMGGGGWRVVLWWLERDAEEQIT